MSELSNDISVENIPFSSYYGALTLLFEMSPNITKLAAFQKFKKLGMLIELALKSVNHENYAVIKIEAEHLKVGCVREIMSKYSPS